MAHLLTIAAKASQASKEAAPCRRASHTTKYTIDHTRLVTFEDRWVSVQSSREEEMTIRNSLAELRLKDWARSVIPVYAESIAMNSHNDWTPGIFIKGNVDFVETPQRTMAVTAAQEL